MPWGKRHLGVHVCCGIVVWERPSQKEIFARTALCAQQIALADKRIAAKHGKPGETPSSLANAAV